MQRAENERLQAEIEGRRLRQQLQALENEKGAPPPAPGAGLLAMLAPFAPTVLEFVRSWMDNQRRTTEALVEAVQSRAEAPPSVAAPPAAASGITLESLLQLVPHLKDLRKFLGSFGGGDTEPAESGSETVRMIEGVRDLLTGIRGAAGADAPAPPAVVDRAPAPPPPKKPTPEQIMSLRVQRFLLAVFTEQQATSDPSTAADKLFPAIGSLPEEFRNLLASSQNVDALLTGLPKWLPAAMRTSVPNSIRQDQAKRAWLEQFLATVHEIAGNADAGAE